MGRKRGIPKAPEEVLSEIETDISNAKDRWATNTIRGFRSDWNEWYSNYVFPALVTELNRLPDRTDDINANIDNRAKPIAHLISRRSKDYRRMQRTKLIPAPRVPGRPAGAM